MILEEIKRSLLIYGTALLTPRKIRDASQSKSVLCMLSAITCFVGYYPQGHFAYTMVAAKQQSSNTHTQTHSCIHIHSHSHAEREGNESNMMINSENSRKSL